MGSNESVQVNGFLQNIDFPLWTALQLDLPTDIQRGKIAGS
jgi:hypothetical protein